MSQRRPSSPRRPTGLRPPTPATSRLARATAVLLGLSTIALGLVFVAALLPVVAVRLAVADPALALALSDTQGVASIASAAALASIAASAAAFMAWLRRTGVPTRSLGWFLVPVVNLVRPYRIVRELHDDLAAADRPVAPIRAWWFCSSAAVVPTTIGLVAGWLPAFYVASGVLPLVAGFFGVTRIAPDLPLPIRLLLSLPASLVVLAAIAAVLLGAAAAVVMSASADGAVAIDAGMVEVFAVGVALTVAILAIAGGILSIRVVLEIDRRAGLRAAAHRPADLDEKVPLAA